MQGKSITIHNLEPETARLLEARAGEEGLSLNRLIKKLLAQALGVDSPAERRAFFEQFCGIWTGEELEEFEEATRDTREVDPEEWT